MEHRKDSEINAFVQWFKRYYPSKANRFTIEERDEGGVMIVCDEGTVVSFRDFYAHRLGLQSSNAIMQADDPAYTEATEASEEETQAYSDEGRSSLA